MIQRSVTTDLSFIGWVIGLPILSTSCRSQKQYDQTYRCIVRVVVSTYGPFSMLVGSQGGEEVESDREDAPTYTTEEGNDDDVESRDDDNEAEESGKKGK
ncbi:hypothetical protein HAX54_046390 [Datura stramonium]|uniref:Uncharacterized protein n=1 Tax=Datura stramonium TaxID=4076 RepID=A0ABS8WKL3_DATST|nr:hypothetical protein [Datura stramonium]